MIALGVFVLMPGTLGHYIVRNVTKFQNCRSDYQFFLLVKKHYENILKRSIKK